MQEIEIKVWNKLKGLRVFDVPIQHNYICGTYYSSSYKNFPVFAQSPDHARQIVLDNLEAVEDNLRSKRSLTRGRLLIRKSEKKRLKDCDISNPSNISSLISGKVLTEDGSFIMYNRDEY